MPKLRADLQTNANQIDWRIATVGKPAVLQIHPRSTFFVVEWGRPRLPQLRLEGYQGPNNLMYIPSGVVLDSRYVRIFPNHYMSQFVDDPGKRMKWGIITRKGVHYVRIYDVVNGLAYAERRTTHILAGYEAELQELRRALNEIEATLSGPTFLIPDRELRALQRSVVKIQLREGEIQRILADRAVRDVNLHFAMRKAESRLLQMGATVERWSAAIRNRPNQIRIGSVQQMTNPILSELPFFGSKEIRPLVNQVRRAFGVFKGRDDTNGLATSRLAVSLGQAATVLFQAAEVLDRETLAISDEERDAASRVRNGLV